MKEQKQWKFYRSNLSTIIWDKDNNRPLANFEKGFFITEDKRVVKILKEEGYPEVSIDAIEPPEVIVNQFSEQIEGDIPILPKTIIDEQTVSGPIKRRRK